jgi:glycosyltransferase involved in cell wall biosynthesis
MKIAIVHNRYREYGGEDVVVEREHRLLLHMGHQVAPFIRSNFAVEEMPAVLRYLAAPRFVHARTAAAELAEFLRVERPDVVHVHNTFYVLSPSIYAVCAESGTPVVQTLHNYRMFCPSANFFRDGRACEECVTAGLQRAVQYGCCNQSHMRSLLLATIVRANRSYGAGRVPDAYIAPSEFTRDKHIELGFPAEKFWVKPNFVDDDPGPRSGIGDFALFVGRLSPEKGVRTLLAAWRMLPHIPLHIIGDGPLHPELHTAAVEQRMPVTFLGRQPRDEVFEAMRRARFLVFPSDAYETFGLSIAEAFACSLPVLCSGHGSMATIVANGKTGLHFIPGDAADLAAKVAWAWSHVDEISRMGVQARQEYETKYTMSHNSELLENIYRSLLRDKRRSHPTLAA